MITYVGFKGDGTGHVLVKVHGVKSANLRTILSSGDVIRLILKLIGYISRATSQHIREPAHKR